MNWMRYWMIAGFTMLSLALYAQQEGDALHLENGTILRGELVEPPSDSTYAIQLIGGSMIVVAKTEVVKKAREPLWEAGKNPWLPPIQIHTGGWYNYSRLAITAGNLTTQQNRWGYQPSTVFGFSVQNVTGYRWHRLLWTGVGVGFDYYGSYALPVFPLFVEVQGTPWKKAVSPFYMMQAGYGYVSGQDYSNWGYRVSEKGGWYGQVGLGVKFFSRSEVNYGLVAGVSMQQTKRIETYDWENTTAISRTTLPRLRLAFEIGF